MKSVGADRSPEVLRARRPPPRLCLEATKEVASAQGGCFDCSRSRTPEDGGARGAEAEGVPAQASVALEEPARVWSGTSRGSDVAPDAKASRPEGLRARPGAPSERPRRNGGGLSRGGATPKGHAPVEDPKGEAGQVRSAPKGLRRLRSCRRSWGGAGARGRRWSARDRRLAKEMGMPQCFGGVEQADAKGTLGGPEGWPASGKSPHPHFR